MARLERRRICWITLGTLVATLLFVAAVAWYRGAAIQMQPSEHLAHVVQLEQASVDQSTVQPLGWSLAILGRDHEVRRLHFFPALGPRSPALDVDKLELLIVPWKQAIERIAANHRIVMIMENHFVSKHREFIGATLETCRDAGFTHYAAEAIGPMDKSLAKRGYPTSQTGFYTSDPRFGNVLRRALGLDLTVLGYDFRSTTHEAREEHAAAALAELLQKDAGARLLVHAGHAHVLKYETKLGERWLASRLWQKTGIEPFTIWQWSSGQDAHDYAEIVRVLKGRGVSLDEPVLLMPPPPIDCGLRDSPYGLASVDAMVIHPPDESVAPAERTPLFPDRMQRIAGRWTSDVWPVVVSAYKHGEPINAVPLDQIMLREKEDRFVLWIPARESYEIRVFNSQGVLKSRVETNANWITVRLANE